MSNVPLPRPFPPICMLAAVLLMLAWAPTARAQAPDAAPLPAPDEAYLAELVAAADARSLWDEHFWHLLMHYRPGFLNRPVSDVDGVDFFNAPDGKRNPRAELEATLAAFFSPLPENEYEQHPQCRFAARYRWLKQQLGFDPERLPEQLCTRLAQWKAALTPSTVVLVFPSAYLNNPASMFGHTMLRLDKPGRPELLDYALNYAAHMPENAGPLYPLLGLLGFYPGRFSILPYYVKVQTYGEIENRDIWEYRLALDDSQVDRMLTHAWELGPTYFDYFFLKENCSYHLLSLLEVADPSLDLTSRFTHWTIPTDTLRAIMEQPGLVSGVEFRPARSTIIAHYQREMPRAEVRLARRIARGKVAPDAAPVRALSGPERADLLELAHDYLLYIEAEADAGKEFPELAVRKHRVLAARSAEGAAGGVSTVPVPPVQPDQGHPVRRALLGAGEREGEPFAQVAYRAAYHDLLDPVPGYDPRGQLGSLDLEVRHFTDTGRNELSRLTVLDILSLSPWDGFFRNRSWKMEGGWLSRRAGECAGCGAAHLNFGSGLSLGAGANGGFTAYLFAEADANFGARFDRDHAIGPAVRGGLLLGSGRLRAHLNGVVTRYLTGQQFLERRTRAEGRVTLTRNLTVRLSAEEFERGAGGSVSEWTAALHLFW